MNLLELGFHQDADIFVQDRNQGRVASIYKVLGELGSDDRSSFVLKGQSEAVKRFSYNVFWLFVIDRNEGL